VVVVVLYLALLTEKGISNSRKAVTGNFEHDASYN
jgi:hypothetical protein